MSNCSNCGKEVLLGAAFCMECGARIPQEKKCIRCGKILPFEARFCFACGQQQDGAPSETGINTNAKMVHGDVIGQKVAGDNVQNKVMGNVINNTFQDETKKVVCCHVCGKHLTNDNGHTCPGCGNVVCDDHFNVQKNLCLRCVDARKQDALKQYESALLSIGANGRIDVIERNKLDVIADFLGLSKAETLPLEQKFKLQVNVSTLTRTEQMTLEAIQKTYFEGNIGKSFEEIKNFFEDVENLFERHPNDEEVVNWYLRFARVLKPDETIDVIAKLQGEFCESYLSLACIYISKNQIPDAEIALDRAKQMCPNSTIVKCTEVLFLFKLFKTTSKSEILNEAETVLNGIDSVADTYESFLVKNERILLAYFQNGEANLDKLDSGFLNLIDLDLPIATNKYQLKSLIDEAIKANGWRCDLNFIDVSRVTDMSHLFSDSQFNGDISKWNVSNVTNMGCMFNRSKFNGDISKWNVSNVTNMCLMFSESKFNGNISKWDVSNVTNMCLMFANTPFNGDVSQWDVSNVTDMNSMFSDSKFNGDISKWDVSNVTNMSSMFANTPFNGDVSQWDVSNVTDMSSMFHDTPFNGDISKWDVSNVTDMSWMFHDTPFNGDIGKWDVSNVTNMSYMFDLYKSKLPSWYWK